MKINIDFSPYYYVIYFTFYYRCYSEKICQDLSRKFHVIVKNDKNDINAKCEKNKFPNPNLNQNRNCKNYLHRVVSMTDLRIDIFV